MDLDQTITITLSDVVKTFESWELARDETGPTLVRALRAACFAVEGRAEDRARENAVAFMEHLVRVTN